MKGAPEKACCRIPASGSLSPWVHGSLRRVSETTLVFMWTCFPVLRDSSQKLAFELTTCQGTLPGNEGNELAAKTVPTSAGAGAVQRIGESAGRFGHQIRICR